MIALKGEEYYQSIESEDDLCYIFDYSVMFFFRLKMAEKKEWGKIDEIDLQIIKVLNDNRRALFKRVAIDFNLFFVILFGKDCQYVFDK